MNMSGNSRYNDTEGKIQCSLMELLGKKSLNTISVSDICTMAHISRPSFYAHYDDINDLIMHIEQEKSSYIASIFVSSDTLTIESFEMYLKYILENQLFYKAYFEIRNNTKITGAIMEQYAKANHLSDSYKLRFQMNFYMAGIRAVVYDWICTPDIASIRTVAELLYRQYLAFMS